MAKSKTIVKCKKCSLKKNITLFRTRKINNKIYTIHICRECERAFARKYYLENKDKLKVYKKLYNIKNREIICEKKKAYDKERYLKNKDSIKSRTNKWAKNNRRVINANKCKRRRTDSCYKLRYYISTQIYRLLKSKKDNLSILKYLPYSIKELTAHLESKFKPWMSWDNWGRYNKETWKTEDCSTWTWNLDHIISQSNLPYDSMKHPNFKKCWALSNLRPLSAKQNILDGARNVSHK